MSNRIKHQKLLAVPYQQRDQAWYDKVNALLVKKTFICQPCQEMFFEEVFKDEDRVPKQCHKCRVLPV